MTVNDLIKLTLKMIGVLAVGQTPLAEDANDLMALASMMISQFNQNRWLIYHLVDIPCLATAATSYSVGPGGNFNVTRPDRLEAAYARLLQTVPAGSGPVDYPLQLLQTHEEYAAIGIKSLQSFPSYAFYDPTLTTGTLYVWPIPSANFELHVVVKETLPGFTSLTQTVNLPPEYQEAILYNLAARAAVMYQLPPHPGILALAKASLNAIAVANTRIPILNMPAGLARDGWSGHGVGGIVQGTDTFDDTVLG